MCHFESAQAYWSAFDKATEFNIYHLTNLISEISKLSKEWELFVDPLKRVSELSVGEQQRVEIIRCLMQNPKLLIMDEPTSVLTPQEISNLFKILKRLASSGCSILYISHKLEEIVELADQVTILKSGKSIATIDAKKTNTKFLAETMVGKEIIDLKKTKSMNVTKETALELQGLNKAKETDFGISLKNINLKVNYGEILGVAGIAGNGQVELMEALSGETTGEKEEIIFEEKYIGNFKIDARRQIGIEFVPEERNNHATVPDLKLHENTFLTFFGHFQTILLKLHVLDHPLS